MRALISALRHTAGLLGAQRKLWVPFLVIAFIEAMSIGLAWLAPHPPFSTILAPPVRYFFGDRVLHYPWHLLFLYQVMKHTHVVAATLIGAFMTGVACAMVRQIHEDAPVSLRAALVSRQVGYVRVVILWLITWGLAKVTMEAVSALAPRAGWVIWYGILLTVVLQALFVYAIPAAVFERTAWWKALYRSLRETLRYPFSTLVIVALASAPVIAFAIFTPSARVSQWMMQIAPEIAVACVAARLLVWTVADVFLTVATAHLWWVHRAAAPSVASPRAASASALGFGAGSKTAAIIALLALLVSGGCSASYNGERLFWKAEQLSQPVIKDPKSATPEQLETAIHAFERVIRTVPGTEWAAKSHLAIASFYGLQKNYPKAREVYGLVLQNYSQFPGHCLGARFAIAKTYEVEGNWEEAAKVYQDIADYHPWSPLGLEAPLYLARTYEQRKDQEAATQAYERAVGRYLKLIPAAPSPEMAMQAKSFLTLVYQRLGRWSEAIRLLEELAQLPAGVNRPLVLLTLGSIYQMRLNETKKAEEAYTKLFTEFPDHPFGKVAKAQLERLGVNVSRLTPQSTTPQAASPH